MKFISVLCVVVSLATMTIFSGCKTPDSKDENAKTDQFSSRDITSEVNDRLRQDSVTDRYVFGVNVEDGVVTLSGHVRDAAVRMRAVGIVRSTPGVKGVVDNTTSY